jgi:hypothetical protein
MTVATTSNKIQYAGNGSTTLFNFPYALAAAADLVVILTDNTVPTAPVDTTQTISTNYTVALLTTGANVTMNVAPTASQYLTIKRVVAYTQTTSYPESGIFPAKSHETALDKLTYEIQQIAEVVARAPTLRQASQVATPPSFDDPIVNNYLVYDSTGTKIVNGGTNTATSATAAATSATASATSASASAASASAAAASAVQTAADVVTTANSVNSVAGAVAISQLMMASNFF